MSNSFKDRLNFEKDYYVPQSLDNTPSPRAPNSFEADKKGLKHMQKVYSAKANISTDIIHNYHPSIPSHGHDTRNVMYPNESTHPKLSL